MSRINLIKDSIISVNRDITCSRNKGFFLTLDTTTYLILGGSW